jgi:hypothetical protein
MLSLVPEEEHETLSAFFQAAANRSSRLHRQDENLSRMHTNGAIPPVCALIDQKRTEEYQSQVRTDDTRLDLCGTYSKCRQHPVLMIDATR